MVGIYKITSPSDKIYIGQSWDIENRENGYRKSKCRGQRHLYASFKKYGFLSHKFETCETLNDFITQEKLDEKEAYYYHFYKNQGFTMLNIKIPGKGPGRHHEETKRKIGLANCKPITQFDLTGKFIKHWDSTEIASKYLKISPGVINSCLRRKSRQSKGFMFKRGIIQGDILPLSPRKKYVRKIQRIYKKQFNPVIQYDADGNIIKYWENAKEAKKEINRLLENIIYLNSDKITKRAKIEWVN